MTKLISFITILLVLFYGLETYQAMSAKKVINNITKFCKDTSRYPNDSEFKKIVSREIILDLGWKIVPSENHDSANIIYPMFFYNHEATGESILHKKYPLLLSGYIVKEPCNTK